MSFRVVGILGAVLLFGWFLLSWISSPVVLVTNPIFGPAVQAVYATGTVEAEVMLPIATRWTARLVELNVDEGSEVKKDQVLAKLESEDLQNSFAAARARETLAKSEFERAASLVQKGATSQQAFDKAKWDWEAAKAGAAEAKAQSSYMNLVAPSDGIIIRRDGEIGQLIPANQAVLWLSSSSQLRITAEVDEEDISLVKVDQAVAIRADAFPGKVFKGKIKSITPKGDPIARSYRVRISFTESTPLQIGMTTETNIIASEKQDALLIPATSVKDGMVWVVRNSKLEKQPITIGASGPKQVAVVTGLSTDELVVIEPNSDLEVNEKVRTKVINQAG